MSKECSTFTNLVNSNCANRATSMSRENKTLLGVSKLRLLCWSDLMQLLLGPNDKRQLKNSKILSKTGRVTELKGSVTYFFMDNSRF